MGNRGEVYDRVRKEMATVEAMAYPLRIVSLVPSLTQTVCDLGLCDAVLGCTKFCVRPKGLFRKATIVGGTKDPELDRIAALNPTHILMNKEENKPEHIRACEGIAQVVETFPRSPQDVPPMLRLLGKALGGGPQFEASASAIEKAIAATAGVGRGRTRRFLYFIWREPYMVAGHDSYISRTLTHIGWQNVAPKEGRYPELTKDEIPKLGADMLLLSSEPYPFRKRDAATLREEWANAPEMYWIDGQLMSWHGTLTEEALLGLKRFEEGGPQELLRPF